MKYIRSLVLIICLLIPLQSIAQESASTHTKDNVDQLFELAPIKETLNNFPEDLKTQFSQNPFGISSSDNQKLIELFTEHFNADSLYNVAQKNFAENFDPEQANAALESLQSDSIKPVIEAESDFYSVQGIRKQIVTKYELEQDEPSEDRIALIKDVIDYRAVNDTEIESQEILFRTFVAGTDKISSDLSLGEAQVKAIVDNFTNRMQMQLDDELKNNYLVMYHGLSDDQLKNYADFYETEAGTEFNDLIEGAIHAAFQEGSDRFLNAVESL